VQIFKGRLQRGSLVPKAPAASLPVSTREVVLEQTWDFNEEEGVFTLNFASVSHPSTPEQEIHGIFDALLHWNRPVRAQVCACSISD
jgi:hypothetical protein